MHTFFFKVQRVINRWVLLCCSSSENAHSSGVETASSSDSDSSSRSESDSESTTGEPSEPLVNSSVKPQVMCRCTILESQKDGWRTFLVLWWTPVVSFPRPALQQWAMTSGSWVSLSGSTNRTPTPSTSPRARLTHRSRLLPAPNTPVQRCSAPAGTPSLSFLIYKRSLLTTWTNPSSTARATRTAVIRTVAITALRLSSENRHVRRTQNQQRKTAQITARQRSVLGVRRRLSPKTKTKTRV